jgi:3-isopropylmalate dehydrogenase
MRNLKVLLLPGDGIGQEVTASAGRILEKVASMENCKIELLQGQIGGSAIDAMGDPLPKQTLDLAKECDAILLGGVGGPKWDDLPTEKKPEKGLLRIRQELDLFANLRPALLFPSLVSASSLKPELVENLDILILRELTGGIYFGEPRGVELRNNERTGFNTLVYSEGEIDRIGRVAFELAQKRDRKLCSVDKANVLEVSQLWREVLNDLASDYPDVELSHMYVDNAAMQLVREPKQFDVIVTGNMFGDILSDVAAMLTGSLGMLPSASIASNGLGLYEPVHGTAPDIAGQDRANPLATILSVAMMCKYSLDLPEAAISIEKAVSQVLENGYRTSDILSEDGQQQVGCIEMGELVLERL